MRTLEELMNVNFNDMTDEEKELAVDMIAAMSTIPVFDLSADENGLVATFDEKETEKEFKKIKKLFKF